MSIVNTVTTFQGNIQFIRYNESVVVIVFRVTKFENITYVHNANKYTVVAEISKQRGCLTKLFLYKL